ncbi:MAG: efflux RND transporter periplasmic adaptor subunit [Pseudomonadota bacterium]
MNTNNPSRWRLLWILPPIAVGILVLMFMAGGRQPPAKVDHGETARAVRIIEAPRLDLVPTAEGYGAVQPARVWTAVAQAAGRIVEIHPQLREGEILPPGTVLIRVDPVDYELKLAQANAELAELAVQEENARASLDIEQRNLDVAQRELERLQKLASQGTASRSDADTAERAALSTRTAVQNMQNTLALIPTKRKLLEARMAQAERDLAHTVIRAPFNLRVANLKVEADQYVAKGQSLFEGDAVDRVEIKAQVAISSLRRLVIGRQLPVGDISRMNEHLPKLLGFRPVVRLDLGGHVAEWQAEFVRFSDAVDPDTRTMGVVVAVDKPFEKVRPGYRPPLSKGMFAQVILRGQAQEDRVVVPRAAIRDGTLYLVDEENRLRRQPVEVLFNQGSLSVIQQGVNPGDRVVLSDLVPAVDGMLLKPEMDEARFKALLAEAGGES